LSITGVLELFPDNLYNMDDFCGHYERSKTMPNKENKQDNKPENQYQVGRIHNEPTEWK
jgi:hypothetical protein